MLPARARSLPSPPQHALSCCFAGVLIPVGSFATLACASRVVQWVAKASTEGVVADSRHTYRQLALVHVQRQATFLTRTACPELWEWRLRRAHRGPCQRDIVTLEVSRAESFRVPANWRLCGLGLLIIWAGCAPQLGAPADEGRIAAALRTACAAVMARHGGALRRAAVAQWEVRLRVPDASGAWRLVVSSPTGAP